MPGLREERGARDRQARCRLRSGKTVMTGLGEYKTVLSGLDEHKTVMAGIGEHTTVMTDLGGHQRLEPRPWYKGWVGGGGRRHFTFSDPRSLDLITRWTARVSPASVLSGVT